jgi:hypothetical protein
VICSRLIVDSGYEEGTYIRCNDRLSMTATGKSRPRESPARGPDRKVNLGGSMSVEKNKRCPRKAAYKLRSMSDQIHYCLWIVHNLLQYLSCKMKESME